MLAGVLGQPRAQHPELLVLVERPLAQRGQDGLVGRGAVLGELARALHGVGVQVGEGGELAGGVGAALGGYRFKVTGEVSKRPEGSENLWRFTALRSEVLLEMYAELGMTPDDVLAACTRTTASGLLRRCEAR
ncbi:hypothetical protein BBK82_16825 [Lentzea guizhouensis]|uniref:Uncharacterized protein n=1 Tax=Lentzea guizhouensis TaxID=1586287 RepID=A0A1B2HIB1_9PSEU|nr:hypothetical protein [Lentzea guizhouensis]ANZ37464.1 hypothetical protein BBK82_16825 [Lentzea guizhouensis]